MIDLKNYVPEEPVFKLPKDTPFPRVIFEGAKSMDDIRKLLSGKFICDGVPSGSAVRYLDEYEKRSLRANYSELKEAKDKLQSVITQIRDLVYQVKRGEKEVDLPADTTIRMPLNGYYLYYAWIAGKFQLCRVDKIPSWDEQNLFANLETNKQAFLDVFGIDIDTVAYGQTATQEMATE